MRWLKQQKFIVSVLEAGESAIKGLEGLALSKAGREDLVQGSPPAVGRRSLACGCCSPHVSILSSFCLSLCPNVHFL